MDIFHISALHVAEHLLLLISGTVKALVLLLLATGTAFLLRHASAAVRHWVWSLALGGVLLLPLFIFATPAWNVAPLPLPALDRPDVSATSTTPSWHNDTYASDGKSAFFDLSEGTSPADPFISEDATAPVFLVPVIEQPSSPSHEAGAGWIGWALVAWLAGAMLAALYFTAGTLRAWWWTRTARAMHDPLWIGLLGDVRCNLGVDRQVRLLWSDRSTMPFTWGIFRPVILLPLSAKDWSLERRRIVLMHEAAHVKRWDCLTQAIGQLACVVHWFNPLAWYAAHRLRVERERATDDHVLAAGTRPSTYAQHLLDLAQSLRAHADMPFGAVSMARPSQLEGRLLSILSPETRRTVMDRISMGATAALFAALLIPLAAMQPAAVEMEEQAAGDSTEQLEPTAATPATRVSGPVSAGRTALADTLMHRTFRVQEGGALHLDTDRGSINVRSGQSDRVEVEVHVEGGTEADRERFNVQFEQRDHDVHVTGRLENGGLRGWLRGGNSLRVRYVVEVPPRYDVDLSTAGGTIEVADLEGTVNVRTSGGSLRLGQIEGPVTAQTSGGSIAVEGARGPTNVRTSGGSISLGDIQGDVEAQTSGGGIRVDRVQGRLNARTSGGSITARFTDQPTDASALRTSGGSITVYLADGLALDLHARTSGGRVVTDLPVEVQGSLSRSELRGTIGGGGPALTLQTSAGNIRIRSADASAEREFGLEDEYRGADVEHPEEERWHERWPEWTTEDATELERHLEEAMAEVEKAMEDVAREVEVAIAGLDVGPVIQHARESATMALLETLRELDEEIPEGWAKQGIAAAVAGLLEQRAYESPTIMIEQNGEVEEVSIITILAELPAQAGRPALGRLAENHPDPDVRREAAAALDSTR